MHSGPNRKKPRDEPTSTKYHQTDEERTPRDRNERRRDRQGQSTDEQEPIRQQNRYDPGCRRPL